MGEKKDWGNGRGYPSDIKDIWFYEIPQNIKDKFSSIFAAINEQIAKNFQESANLAQLRDFLLPLLMNGQVKAESLEISQPNGNALGHEISQPNGNALGNKTNTNKKTP